MQSLVLRSWISVGSDRYSRMLHSGLPMKSIPLNNIIMFWMFSKTLSSLYIIPVCSDHVHTSSSWIILHLLNIRMKNATCLILSLLFLFDLCKSGDGITRLTFLLDRSISSLKLCPGFDLNHTPGIICAFTLWRIDKTCHSKKKKKHPTLARWACVRLPSLAKMNHATCGEGLQVAPARFLRRLLDFITVVIVIPLLIWVSSVWPPSLPATVNVIWEALWNGPRTPGWRRL